MKILERPVADHELRRSELEGPLPLISYEECALVEQVGGSFVGFVDQGKNDRLFEDLTVVRRAFYDPAQRKVLTALISAEALDVDGQDGLRAASDVAGYDLLVAIDDKEGHRIESFVLSLMPLNFPGQTMIAGDIRDAALEVASLVTEQLGIVSADQVQQLAKDFLATKGWTTAVRG